MSGPSSWPASSEEKNAACPRWVPRRGESSCARSDRKPPGGPKGHPWHVWESPGLSGAPARTGTGLTDPGPGTSPEGRVPLAWLCFRACPAAPGAWEGSHLVGKLPSPEMRWSGGLELGRGKATQPRAWEERCPTTASSSPTSCTAAAGTPGPGRQGRRAGGRQGPAADALRSRLFHTLSGQRPHSVEPGAPGGSG